MRQVKPGDMAIVIRVAKQRNANSIGRVVDVFSYILPGEISQQGMTFAPCPESVGPYVETGCSAGLAVRSVHNLMIIDPDESITQEQDEGVTA
jgi:hypothetical protein